MHTRVLWARDKQAHLSQIMGGGPGAWSRRRGCARASGLLVVREAELLEGATDRLHHRPRGERELAYLLQADLLALVRPARAGRQPGVELVARGQAAQAHLEGVLEEPAVVGLEMIARHAITIMNHDGHVLTMAMPT